MKILFLNGPARSGKDLAGSMLMSSQYGYQTMKLAEELKIRTHGAFGMTRPADAFEKVKDLQREEFMGLTPREAYIQMHQRFMRPIFGADILGRLLVPKLRQARDLYGRTCAIITDNRFREEMEPIMDSFGVANCILVRLHRRGCDWNQDSGSYIYETPACLCTYSIENNHSKETLLGRLEAILDGHVSGTA